MEKVQVTWANAIYVWWSFVWRCVLFGGIAGALLGGIGGAVAALIGRGELAGTVGGILGYLISIPVSVWALKTVLSMQYKNFSVALVRQT